MRTLCSTTFVDANELSRESFTIGQVHVVQKVKYVAQPQRQWILKSDSSNIFAWPEHAASFGINRENATFAARNVATWLVDLRLGLRLVPETHFAHSAGKAAFVMEFSDALPVRARGNIRPLTIKEQALLRKRQQRVIDSRDGFGKDSPEHRRSETRFSQWARDFGVEINSESGEWQSYELHQQGLNLHDPVLLGRLCDLAWLDAVTGQIDRHLGNFLVSHASGSVQDIVAIDNDFSFPEQFDGFHSQANRNRMQVAHTMGLPPVISALTMQRIRMFVADWAAFRPELEQLLTDAELTATDGRLRGIASHVDGLETAECVGPDADWACWRHPTACCSAQEMLASNQRGTVALLALGSEVDRHRGRHRS